ncbi:MAG: ATP-dependent DNA ligase [Acidimicrobiales bacterium]
MRFARLADASERVAATSSRTAKVDTLAAVLRDLDPGEIEPAVGFLTGTPRQGAIGVGWATVTRLDIAPATDPSLSITEVDAALSRVQALTGPGSQGARAAELGDLAGRATAGEQRYLAALLTGQVRQGALAGVVTTAAARAAGVAVATFRRALMLDGDLGHTTRIALVDGADGLAAIDLTVGRPILPMLASTAADVAEVTAELGQVQVDWKLDGARIQVHRDGDEVGIWTRNLNEITDRLPGVVALVRGLACHRVVLDGEVVGFAPGDGADQPDGAGGERPQPFQDTISAFARDRDPRGDRDREPGAGPATDDGLRVFFFDLMHLDGTGLIDRPLRERSVELDRLAPGHRVPYRLTADPAEAAAFGAEAVARGHEGAMVKAADSPYEAGRRGKAWRKVKPVHTLDLVVMAAEWGHGRRRGLLSNLHLGARDPGSGELVMVGKTFKGLTDELLRWQTERFTELRDPTRSSGHTVAVRPELVVEIALDGAQTSTRYPGGVALRFARVRRYRPDKTPAEADTLDAVRALL